MEDDEERTPRERAESLLPYDAWMESAMRGVVARALSHVAEHGMPGEHHFYLTFRTDGPGVVIPQRLRVQYPKEMTIVLQHQFWDLKIDERAGHFSVGLSFGGVGTTLVIPFASVSTFADPHLQFEIRLAPAPAAEPDAPAQLAAPVVALAAPEPKPAEPDSAPQVVSLDAFRRRGPGKDPA